MSSNANTEGKLTEVSRARAEEMMQFLEIVSLKAREMGAYGGYSKLKHLRHEAKWAYYGIQQFLKGTQSDKLDINSFHLFLVEYFSNQDPDSSGQKLVRLIRDVLQEDRIPTEKEMREAYKIRFSLELDD